MLKSQVRKNPVRAILRWRLKVLYASVIMKWYKRLIIALATQGLLHLCSDLGIDQKDQETIAKRSRNEENFITELLPTLGKAFDRGLGDGYFSPPVQFHCSESGLPIFLGSLIGEIFGQDGRLLDNSSAESVRKVRQVCFYAYKLDLPYDESKQLQVVNGFIRTEHELRVKQRELAAPERAFHTWEDAQGRKVPTDPQTFVAASLVQRVFAEYQPRKLTPKHGPGVTANVPIHQKWTHKLNAGCPVGDLGHLYWFNETDALDRLNRYPTWGSEDYFLRSKSARAEVILVPKDSRGPRLISAEPAERQFLQQGIKNEMVAILQSNPLTSGHVNFDDQSVNQRLALETSQSREWATLDLKDASDRVTCRLVDILFGETLLKRHQMLVRSSVSILPKDGGLLELTKYAPMGSALCFPVLATCVWALAVTAVASCYGSIETAVSKVYVYGDDLIVPADCADLVVQTLEKYLLKVNVDKSFVGSRFAESCGMDAFDGVPVAPVRLKTLYAVLSGDRQGPTKTMVTLVAHAAELREAGFHAASEYYYSLVEEVLGPLPYVTDTSPYLGRETDSASWPALQGEWQERTQKGRSRNFVGWFIEPEKVSDKATDPWAHMYRTHNQWGTGSVDKWGCFTKPRKFKLLDRTYKGNSFACGIYRQPEWVGLLERGASGVSQNVPWRKLLESDYL